MSSVQSVPTSSPCPAAETGSSGEALAVVSALVQDSAWRSERTLAGARAIFCGVVLVRSLLVTKPTPERLETGIPPLVMTLAFSLYLLTRSESFRPKEGFFVLSIAFEALAGFTILLPMALWPELPNVPLLDKADISALLLVVASSAFRHSVRASLASWLLNTASFLSLMHWDRAAPWTHVEREVALLFLIYLAAMGSMAVLLAHRTRSLVAATAKAALTADRAQRNLALVLREHHDLRSQLSSATLNAGLAERELSHPTSPRLKAFVERVRLSLERVNGVVAAIKEHSYEEIADLDASRPADLAAAARAVQRELTRRFPNTRFELCVPARGPAPLVAGGSDGLRRLLLNVATNACEGSGARAAAKATLESCATASGDISILVRDDGPGFTLAADGRTRVTSKPDGFGLGLALVRRIAEASGGSVHFGNDEDGGARVELLFPSEPENAEHVTSPPSSTCGEGAR